jgi:AcrR family transcriptional regulator
MEERTSKGGSTRAAILRAAVSAAGVEGLAGLSIGRLAASTGLSKSGLFAHFGSKEALQKAVLEQAAEDFRQAVVLPALRAASGIARLAALFERWLAWAASDALAGGCPLFGASIELDDKPGALRDYLAARQRAWLDCIAAAAERAIAEGDLRTDLDARHFAFEFHGMALAFHCAHRLLDDTSARARAETAFRGLVASARVERDFARALHYHTRAERQA